MVLPLQFILMTWKVLGNECFENVITSIKLLNSLGFIIYSDKHIFLSKQEITSLGFNINSQKMEITLTDPKEKSLLQ